MSTQALYVLSIQAAKEHVLRNPEVPSKRRRNKGRKGGIALLDVSS